MGYSLRTELIASSSVTAGIIDFAEKEHVDLIVVGALGRSGFKKLLLGSVASSIVNYAHCPVPDSKVEETFAVSIYFLKGSIYKHVRVRPYLTRQTSTYRRDIYILQNNKLNIPMAIP